RRSSDLQESERGGEARPPQPRRCGRDGLPARTVRPRRRRASSPSPRARKSAAPKGAGSRKGASYRPRAPRRTPRGRGPPGPRGSRKETPPRPRRRPRWRTRGRPSRPPPAPPVPREERDGRVRAPRARLVVRVVERRVVAPRIEHRRHVLPRGLDLVAPGEERGVAMDRIHEKPFVGLGLRRAEELAIA